MGRQGARERRLTERGRVALSRVERAADMALSHHVLALHARALRLVIVAVPARRQLESRTAHVCVEAVAARQVCRFIRPTGRTTDSIGELPRFEADDALARALKAPRQERRKVYVLRGMGCRGTCRRILTRQLLDQRREGRRAP